MKKVILITGASSGMGKVTAIDLAQKGHIVYGAARNVNGMKELVEAGGHALGMDVTSDAELKKGVSDIIKKEGRIDVLWNNAGYGLYGPVEEISMEAARNEMEVNVFGLARLTQLVIPHMRKQKSGLIINTSSMGGRIYFPLGAWYHASKHALEGFSDCLRIELKPFGIDVVVLEPGAIETGFYDVMSANIPKKSLKGPYKKLVSVFVNMDTDSMQGSSASVISETVQEIIDAERPKTRYVVGRMARPMMFIRKWGGDRIFDRILSRMIR